LLLGAVALLDRRIDGGALGRQLLDQRQSGRTDSKQRPAPIRAPGSKRATATVSLPISVRTERSASLLPDS